MDYIFIALFSIESIVLGFVSYKVLCHKENRKPFIIMTVVCVLCTMLGKESVYPLDRIANLIYLLKTSYDSDNKLGADLFELVIVEIPFTLMINA